MWLTTDTTSALVKARNDEETLASVKEGDPEPASGAAGISGTLEAIAAVIPTGVAAIYTGGVLLVRGVALDAGTEKRATTEAALAAAGKSAAEIKAALEALPLETTSFIGARWILFAVALAAAAIMAWRAAGAGNGKATKKRRLLLAEPLTAVAAFVGWALASPGTPLAAYFNANEVLVYTIVIGVVAGLGLLASGALVLKKAAPTK